MFAILFNSILVLKESAALRRALLPREKDTCSQESR
jgi:hypothetical protein